MRALWREAGRSVISVHFTAGSGSDQGTCRPLERIQCRKGLDTAGRSPNVNVEQYPTCRPCTVYTVPFPDKS